VLHFTMLCCVLLCCAPGAALKIFEALEMWDQLIVCYRLLDKKQVAQELVLARLQVCAQCVKFPHKNADVCVVTLLSDYKHHPSEVGT
jgi:hypothetical protein